MINTSKNKKKWLFYAVSGLLLIGLGLSIFGEAIIQKINNSSFISWGLWGTLALVVFNTGICLFGQAVIERMQLNNALEK